jgi:hypothetical protein
VTLIAIRIDHLDSYSGQHDFCLSAALDGEFAGAIRYSEYEGHPYVQMINVVEDKRRQGVGSAMIVALQEAYPDKVLSFGMATSAGDALLRSLEWRTEVNEQVVSVVNEIVALTQKLEEYEVRAEEILLLPMSDRPSAMIELNDWDGVSDRLEELQALINTQPAEFRYVVGPKSSKPVFGM